MLGRKYGSMCPVSCGRGICTSMLALKIYFPTLRFPIAESLMFPKYDKICGESWKQCLFMALYLCSLQETASPRRGQVRPSYSRYPDVWNFPWRDLLQVTIAQRTKNPQYLNPQANQLCTIFNQNMSFKSDKAEHIQTSVVNRKPMFQWGLTSSNQLRCKLLTAAGHPIEGLKTCCLSTAGNIWERSFN